METLNYFMQIMKTQVILIDQIYCITHSVHINKDKRK